MEQPQLCLSAKIPMDSGGFAEVNIDDVSEVAMSHGRRGIYMTIHMQNMERHRIKVNSIDEAVAWMKELKPE